MEGERVRSGGREGEEWRERSGGRGVEGERVRSGGRQGEE